MAVSAITHSPAVTASARISELNTALQLQEKAVEIIKNVNASAAVSPSQTKGSRLDISV